MVLTPPRDHTISTRADQSHPLPCRRALIMLPIDRSGNGNNPALQARSSANHNARRTSVRPKVKLLETYILGRHRLGFRIASQRSTKCSTNAGARLRHHDHSYSHVRLDPSQVVHNWMITISLSTYDRRSRRAKAACETAGTLHRMIADIAVNAVSPILVVISPQS